VYLLTADTSDVQQASVAACYWLELQVYQRQIMKSDLASATMVSGSSAAGLSQNELKQLFSLELGTECATKQLLQSCKAGEGVVWLTLPEAGAAAGEAAPDSSSSSSIPRALAAAVAAGCVTAINRELQPGDLALQQQQAAGAPPDTRTHGAEAVAEQDKSISAGAAAAAGGVALADDVDQLEVDWEDDD
jgi:DNA repair and recombination protein RAD54B